MIGLNSWEVFQDAEKLFDHLSPPVEELQI